MIITDDGTVSLYSHEFQQAYHHSSGALKETYEKFIPSAELESFQQQHPTQDHLRFCDVCVGLGYQTMATYTEAAKLNLRCQSIGLEISKDPLCYAAHHPSIQNLWPSQVVKRIQSLAHQGYWCDEDEYGLMLWDDARQSVLKLAQHNQQFDLIYLDPFCPKVCPELWSLEFLTHLTSLLTPTGRLITYGRSAALRSALKSAECEIFSITPPQTATPACWSYGTVAFKTVSSWSRQERPFKPLTIMEQEHLDTKSGIHYSDPTMKGTASQIRTLRSQQQQQSNRPSAKSWRHRWRHHQSPMIHPHITE